MHELNFPMGITALVNSVECNKMGVFYYDITKYLIKNTKIVAIGCQWFYGLNSIDNIIRKIKGINPDIKIILGGYTATIFSKSILKHWDCDYIVRGDADYSFKILIKNLLNGFSCKEIPNVCGKDFFNEITYTLTSEHFDNMDYTNVEWFYSLNKLMEKYKHATSIGNYYPFVPAFRGCKLNCEACIGTEENQQKLIKRGFFERGVDAIKKDFRYYSKTKKIKMINIGHDLNLFFKKNKLKKIFSEKYNFKVYYLSYDVPGNPEILDKMLGSFNYTILHIPSIISFWWGLNLSRLIDCDKLIKTFKNLKNKNYELSVFVNLDYRHKNKNYLGSLLKLSRELNCYFVDTAPDIVSIPLPKDNEKELENDFFMFTELSRQEPFFTKIQRIIVFFVVNLRMYFMLRLFKEFMAFILLLKIKYYYYTGK